MHNVEIIIGEGILSTIKGNYDENKNNQNAIDVDLHCKEIEHLKFSESNLTHAKSYADSSCKTPVNSKKS